MAQRTNRIMKCYVDLVTILKSRVSDKLSSAANFIINHSEELHYDSSLRC